jgi:hypothetical protein
MAVMPLKGGGCWDLGSLMDGFLTWLDRVGGGLCCRGFEREVDYRNLKGLMEDSFALVFDVGYWEFSLYL